MKKFVRFIAFAFAFTLALVPARVLAWWDMGHMVVAQIAYDNLDKGTQRWADSLIGTVTAHYPETFNFVEASAWPDDLKKHGINVYDSWHYTNIPLNDDGVAIACDATPQVDVVWAIGQARAILASPKAKMFEKGEFLAFLIHFVGDLHQPLHSTSMYTNSSPGGDRGGNGFYLKDSLHSNLHKLWDDGCGYFDQFGKVDRTDPKRGWQEVVEKAAKATTKAYPSSAIVGVDVLDAAAWALESHNVAVSAGYKGIQSVNGSKSYWLKPNETPTALYLQEGQKIVAMRVAAAGYRLAAILNGIHAGLGGK
jgi:S1/P1 Nuclease